MSKKFKLVYESDGMLKGSYSGIPAKSDEALIERAVLEGSKPVPPAPEPAPAPGPDTSLLPDFFVPFMDTGEDGVDELREFIQLTAESDYEELCTFLADLKFKAKFPLSEETRDKLEDVIIYHTEATSAEIANIYYYSIKDASAKYYTSVVIEADAETGNSWYIFGEIVREE